VAQPVIQDLPIKQIIDNVKSYTLQSFSVMVQIQKCYGTFHSWRFILQNKAFFGYYCTKLWCMNSQYKEEDLVVQLFYSAVLISNEM
jgi:hypothetical protein